MGFHSFRWTRDHQGEERPPPVSFKLGGERGPSQAQPSPGSVPWQ